MSQPRRFSFFTMLAFTLAMFLLHLDAAVDQIDFKRMGVENGLSQSTANCMLQDRTGFIWFGTEDGLNKFDGYQFTVYRPIPGDLNSISSNSIWALHQDRKGNIWIGTYNGLNLFNPNTERMIRFMPDGKNLHSIPHKYVRTIVEDRTGTLWVGTYGGGLCRFDSIEKGFSVFKHNPEDDSSLSSDYIYAIKEAPNGILWIGTDNGLNRFDLQTGRFSRLFSDPTSPNNFSGHAVKAIYADWEGFLWIGTENGLNRFDPVGNKNTVFRHSAKDMLSISHDNVLAIFEDRTGTLWVGTEGGLNAFDRRQNTFTRFVTNTDDPQSLTGNEVRSIMEDRMGSIWIGLWASGICKYEPFAKKFNVYRHAPNSTNTLSQNSVQAIYEDPDGILWIGTNGGGLNRFDRHNSRFTVFVSDPQDPSTLGHDRVRSIFKDSLGTMWIGTYGGGLNRFDPQKGTFQRFRNAPGDESSLSNDRIRSIVEGRDQFLWIGADGGGLNRFDRKTGKFKRYRFDPQRADSLSNDRVMKILIDRTGQMWIATFGGGINRYLPQTDSFRHYVNDPDDANSLSLDYAVTLYEDRNGILWIGTDGAGMDRFDPANGTFSHFTDAHGLPNKTIYAILEDSQGHLWVSHNQGISRFNPKTSSCKNYTKQDGVQGSEFTGNSSFKNPATGEMFFGGIDGFNAFFPEAIVDNKQIPPVIITRFQLFNNAVSVGEKIDGRILLPQRIQDMKRITLSYREKAFAFEFTALNFISSEKNQYAYMMEGFDKSWNYVGNRRFASYTSLPPGRYVFRVKGSNNDGVWNETGASLAIRIMPPFYKTWWFIGLSLLVVGLSAFGWYRQRVGILKKAKADLEGLVALRTQELKDISLKDPLTGLRNRRYISEVLKEDINSFLRKKIYFLKHNQNRRHDKPEFVYGILMVDIDHFKTINDQYGHDMGDRWLLQFSDFLKRHVRSDDEVIRFGGEEFLIVLKNTQPDYIETIARKIKDEASRIELSLANEDLRRSCSIGYTQYPFYHNAPACLTFEKAILLTDLGLYYAKRNGRNMAVQVIPLETIPDEEMIVPMTTSLEFGLEKGLYKIQPFI